MQDQLPDPAVCHRRTDPGSADQVHDLPGSRFVDERLRWTDLDTIDSDEASWAAVDAGVAASDPGDAAGGPQRRHPGGAAAGQPGPAGRAAHAAAAVGPGVDQGPGAGVAGPGERSTVGGVERASARRIPPASSTPTGCTDVVADRVTWAAPRRGRWAALGRRRSRRPDGDDQPAAPRLRQHGRGRSAEDRRQPPQHRPGPGHRHGVLRRHRRRQENERVTAGQVWNDTGYVFTTPDGRRR